MSELPTPVAKLLSYICHIMYAQCHACMRLMLMPIGFSSVQQDRSQSGAGSARALGMRRSLHALHDRFTILSIYCVFQLFRVSFQDFMVSVLYCLQS